MNLEKQSEEANLKIVHSIKNSINDTVRGTFILWIFAFFFIFFDAAQSVFVLQEVWIFLCKCLC